MGIILSALAAAGDAGVQSMNQNIEQQNRLDQMAQQNQNETERDKQRAMMELQNRKELIAAELKAKNDNEETMRVKEIENINNAKEGIINRQLNKKYGESDANVEAAANGETDAPLSPEQQEVYDKAKQADKERIANSRDTYIQAATDAGYIKPKEVMADTSRADKNAIMAEIAANRNESAMDRKKMEADNKLELAKMWINAGKNGGSGGGNEQTALERNVKMLKDMGYSADKVESFIFDKKQSSVEDVAGQLLKLDPFAGTSKAMSMDDAIKKAVGIRQQTQSLLSQSPSNAAPGNKPTAKLDSMFPKK